MRVFWVTVGILLSGSIAVAQDTKPSPGQAGATRTQRPAPAQDAKPAPGSAGVIRAPRSAAKEKPTTTDAEAAKARAAAEAREKARDVKMRRDLRSICTGCSTR